MAKAEFSHRDNEGKSSFLGRDASSWLRIIGFYIVYYSFLAILILFFIQVYESYLPKPGGNSPKIVTRIDQPGASAMPFHGIESSIDGDNSVLEISTSGNDTNSKLYVTQMKEFLKKYNNKHTDECIKPEDVTKKTCTVANAQLLTPKMVAEGIQNHKPIFTISLNKVYDWTPLNRNLDNIDKYSEHMEFKKNSVYFRCYESELNGAEIAKSKFTVKYLGEKGLKSTYFPYKANDKKTGNETVIYQKPFIIGQIVPLGKNPADAWKLESKQKNKFFRCVVDADNIESPKVGDDFTNHPEDRGWSNDLTKLRIGYAQFGIKYIEDTM